MIIQGLLYYTLHLKFTYKIKKIIIKKNLIYKNILIINKSFFLIK